MIQVYPNYIACDTYEEAMVAQGVIVNEMCFVPKICNDRDMFLIEHELDEDKMKELLNQVGLTCK